MPPKGKKKEVVAEPQSDAESVAESEAEDVESVAESVESEGSVVSEKPDEEAEAEDEATTLVVDETPIQEGIYKYTKNIFTAPNERITSKFMKFTEFTQLICIRGGMIEEFNDCLVDIGDLTDPMEMAKRELFMKKSPFTLRRFIGSKVVDGVLIKKYDKFDVNEMILPV